MPRGALSVARQLPPLETVFRGRGIWSRVQGCHLRKYMHIHTKYKHIHHIHTYTYIYIHIHTYTNYHAVDAMHVYWKQQYTCRYMHIRAYTYIYLLLTYIFFRVRISVIYTVIYCIYVHIRAVWKRVFLYGFPKKMHVYCMYFTVFVCIWFSILYVFCMYTRILYVYCSIDATNNFPYRKYVNIRVYCHIHAIYDTYTYNIRHNILQYTYKINQ
jgi:hypothetical protein